MRRNTARRHVLAGVTLATLAIGGIAAGLAIASTSKSVPVVKSLRNATLGKTILVNRRGMTLYRLSAETRGRFICTSGACLSLWRPLVVPRGTKPTGARSLRIVKRPDGRLQVAYRGGPLYTFVQDRRPGEVNGNGVKDVGVWRPVVVGAAGGTLPPPSTPSTTTTSPYPYP